MPTYFMPEGKTTTSAVAYTKAWYKLVAPIETALIVKMIAFDPEVMFVEYLADLGL